MKRELILAKYIKAHEKQLTVESIIIIKEALKYYEENFGELDDDYELEVQCAIMAYASEAYRKELEYG